MKEPTREFGRVTIPTDIDVVPETLSVTVTAQTTQKN